eukprot:symbB.v1.2.036287.t1/scaffold5089.1/size31073/1
MIFWCFLLWLQLLRGHDSFGIKAEERTQAKSIGKTSVVVSQTKPPEAQQEDATGLVRHAGGASFTGPTVVEEHQSCNGECFQYRIGALEMFLHEAQQEDGRVLRTMWEALDKGAGFAGKPMEQMESMGKMGESPNGSGKGIVSESQECFTTQKKQRRQRSWQRWIQERQRCRMWTTICIAIAICELPVSADFNYTVGWRSTSAGSITIPALAVLTSDRVGGCSQQGLWYPGTNAADVRELVDKVAQQSSKNITKELHTEISNLGRAKKALVEISLDPAPQRFNCYVEQTTATVHRAPGNVVGARRTCNTRDPVSNTCHTGAEQQSSWRFRQDLHALHGKAAWRSPKRTRRQKISSTAAQSSGRLRQGYWSRKQGRIELQRRHCHNRFGQRRFTNKQACKVHRKGRQRYFLVIKGRIESCLKMNERCKGQRKVCFDVVEAYDQGNHAAGHVLAFLPLPAFDFKNEGGGLASHMVFPTSQWKPNADIELDFDDDLPVTNSSEEEMVPRADTFPLRIGATVI